MNWFKHRLSKLASNRRYHKTVVGSHVVYFGAGSIGLPGYKFVMALLAVLTVIEMFAEHGE